MFNKLLKNKSRLLLIAFLWASFFVRGQQASVFSQDFTSSAGTSYSTVNGAIGNSTTWSMLRSGTDMGARINSGILSLTNDASGSWNVAGWVLAYTTALTAPYSTTLNANAGTVAWTFNMRQSRSNPSSLNSGYYANAFVLAGTTNTTATTGSGYAVVLGEASSIDRLRLVRYTAGLRTYTSLLQSSTSGLSDFGNQYLSVKVTYSPSTNTWQLYVRNDGTSFQDPTAGTLISQGTVVNNGSTATALPLLGAFWNSGIKNNQTAYFDNIKVNVSTPAITSISPTSKVSGTGAFTLTVNGTNFISGSTVRWNGAALTTTYVSATQLTASVPAANITTAGTAAITVSSGTAISNAQTFTIDQAGVPSITTSTSALTAFSTVTGTASAAQSFTSAGANLTSGSITITAPANFEVATTATGTYAASLNTTAATATTYIRVKAAAPAGIYSGNITLTTTGGVTKQIAVTATVLATEPTTSATAVTFTNTSSIAFTVNWANGNGANQLVVLKAASAIDGSPTDGITYTASSVFGSGAEIGTAGYVIYKGTGSAVTVSGLSAATTYYVSVFNLNGSAGTENYRITTPATGSKTTLNAPIGWQIPAVNTRYTLDFDTTVEGVNIGAYNGGGINTDPDDGELNSYAWAFGPLTTGAATFGTDVSEDDPSFGNGTSDGGVIDGGLYAFEVQPNNFALGIQPAGDYTSGSSTLRFQNQTGAAITSLSIGYKVYVYNDEAGANSYNFSYSANNSTYNAATLLNHTSDAAADAAPGWKAYYKVITLTGLNIASNSYYYFRWSGNSVSGTAYDEIALDDISIVANPTTTFAGFGGTAQTFLLAGNANLIDATTVNGDITFNGGKAIIGANTLTLNGTVTNTTTGGISGSANSNLTVAGTVSPTLSFDQTAVGTTNLLNNLSINTTAANTVTLANNVAVNGALAVDINQTLNLGTNALTGTLGTITNDGRITTQNTTTAPFASGKTWGGTGTLLFNAATAAQTIVTGTYNKVTVSTTGGVTATGNVTLTGDLSLPNANPSAIKGSFDTGVNTLFMGANAFNTGIGDVSGIVTRNVGITTNIAYTFGHPRTTIFYPTSGTLPTAMSLKTTLGAAPAGKSNAILRNFDFIQTGGTGTKATISSHYLDSELNSNTENNLVDWVVIQPSNPVEQGRTNYNTTDNYVELSNVNVAFFSSSFGVNLLTMANSLAPTVTWNGSVSTSWTTAANWTPNATPSDATNVIIPDAGTTPNDPILNSSVTIGTLNIQNGGILNTPAGGQLTITKTSGAWINKGTYNPSTGTVTFNAPLANGDVTMAGSTTFNNLTIPTGTNLRPVTDNVMDIAGAFTKSGNLFAGSVTNTIIYSGTNQTVVSPNGALSAYDNLTITGTGAILPATLNVAGNLITNQAVSFAGTTVNILGAEANGQYIGGTVSPVFNNLVINKPSGSGTTVLQNNITVGGTLTLTSGILDIANYDLTLGANAVAGTFSVTTMIDADGTGHVKRPYTGVGSYTFPIGETVSNSSYSPITVNVTSGTFNNAYVSVNVTDATHPNNYGTSSYFTRYWGVTQTGITNAVATVTGNYILGDAVGGESALSAAQLNGTFNAVTNPWIKFGTLSDTTLTAAGATLTAGQTSYFSGITAAPVTVLISGEGTFCQNSNVMLTANVSGGTGTYTYTWSNGLGNGSTAVPPTATVGTVTYTLTVRDANGNVGTQTAVVTVTAAPNAGTLSANQVICASTTPAAITLSGYVGTIVRWERSINTAFANPTFIASTNATLTGAEIGTTLTSTRYLRAVVQNGSCDVVYSNPVEVKINTTTWNGTAWDNGAPTGTEAVIFTGNYTATESITACTVQVTNDAEVLIPTGYTVTVNGAVTVTSGTFTFQNNAALVQLTNAENTGSITIHKSSNPLYRLDYTMWSSPVENQNLGLFSQATSTNRFYEYKYAQNSSNNWVEGYWSVPPGTTSFAAAKGYLIRMPNSINTLAGYAEGTASSVFDGTFTGKPNNGNVGIDLSIVNNRFTAVGNPYPSPISVSDFFAANNTKLFSATGLYLWRKRNNSASSSYATLSQAGYVANPDDSTTSAANIGSFYQGTAGTWLISQGQGFIVRTSETATTAPQLSFTNSMRRAAPGATQGFFKSAASADSKLWLNLKATGGTSSQALVAYMAEEGTLGLDYGYDALTLADSDAVSIYSVAQSTPLAIQARPGFDVSDVVPMGFTAPAAGQYTISLDHTEGVFSQGQTIYVRDNAEGIIRNLSENDYAFTTEAGNFEGRFDVIYTTTALGTDNPVVNNNAVMAWAKDKAVSVQASDAISSVTLFDITGRQIYHNNAVNSTTFTTGTLAVAQQAVIVKIALANGVEVSKKLILE